MTKFCSIATKALLVAARVAFLIVEFTPPRFPISGRKNRERVDKMKVYALLAVQEDALRSRYIGIVSKSLVIVMRPT